jgi:hypothetical protein
VFGIPFAQLDPAFENLEPSMRANFTRLCDNHRSLREAIYAARTTVRQSRALVARSRGRPYLAAFAGEKTTRS